MSDEKQTTAQSVHDLVVLSDLHLGEGRRSGTQRYSATEDFFQDEAFARFVLHLQGRYTADPSRLVLVLNGDVFDFLTVTRVPTADEARRRGFEVSPAEEKFGLDPTEIKSIFKLDVIFAGHREFFHALAGFISAGHRVEILRGNHDLELHFDGVRQRLLEHLNGFEDGPDLDTARARVGFHEWFYHEPGRVFIEHGNQYDSTNSIRYPLRPLLSPKRWFRKDQHSEPVLDYPLGSIFVRYFYNRVRRLDPHAPRLLSFEQYMDFVRRYNLFDVWRVLRDHYPHFVTALGPSTTTGSARASDEADARQSEEFTRLADEQQGGDLYRELSGLKIHPESASKAGVVRKMVSPLFKRVLGFGLIALVGLGAWMLIMELIDLIPWTSVNVILMSLFVVLSLGALLWAWLHLDRKLRRRPQREVRNCASRAERIGAATGVPLVLMGHTHTVDHRLVNDGRTVYANSGTWTSVANPWNRLLRDARRLTFLQVRGSEVELVRWNDDAGRVDDVPLFVIEDEPGSDIFRDREDPTGRLTTEFDFLPSARMPDIQEEDEES
ncbi:MAG: metallophosphoesterase [Deltaproteobacteria bacterium]|nr:metallophosphoesterase [Deltaproteobacteria bacterium]